MGPSARRLHHNQDELYRAILAEPYDRSILEQSLSVFRDTLNTSQKASHSAFVDVIDALTPAERRLLLEHMRSRAMRHRGEGMRAPRKPGR